jgi:hypothetical protein
MLYNSCTGIHKFGNNAYPRRIRSRSNLGHTFWGKSASYGPGNTVLHTFTLVSISDNLDSKRMLHDVTPDIRVLCKVGLDTFV